MTADNSSHANEITNSLADFWMPFTASDGRRALDGAAGLWCCNADTIRQAR